MREMNALCRPADEFNAGISIEDCGGICVGMNPVIIRGGLLTVAFPQTKLASACRQHPPLHTQPFDMPSRAEHRARYAEFTLNEARDRLRCSPGQRLRCT